MALPNYVKFQRGSLAAYNRLSVKDENTLYFIYDSEDESKGSLYLGARLIGSVGGSGGVSNLSELSDVLVSSANTGDFLVLNSDGKWASVSASEVAQTILNTGNNFVTIDENEFKFNTVNGKLELKGYNEASVGMIPIKSNLGLTWQAAPVDLSSRVETLEGAMLTAQGDISNIQTSLNAVDGKIATAISNANHLTYQVVQNLADATATNTIYLHSNGSISGDDQYNEYMLVNGSLELLGQLQPNLAGYVTLEGLASTTAITSLNTTVSNLTNRVSTLENNDYVLTSTFQSVVGNLSAVNSVLNNLASTATIAETFDDIYDRLTWKELSE